MLAVTQFAEFVDSDLEANKVTRGHVEEFIDSVLDNRSAATAKQRYMSLRTFFGWLVEEDELEVSPMLKMKPPKVEEKPPPILTEAEFDKMLRAASGRSFLDRRDNAILHLLADTGMRASELCGLMIEDVDIDDHLVAHVLGKGQKFRAAPFGHETAQAIDRYLRARTQHPKTHLPNLFLGKRGPITRSWLGRLVRVRGEEVGIEGLHPHLFRHTFAHRWLAQGGQESDLIRIVGWSQKSAMEMLQRYGASAASERAHAAHRRLGPVDNR